MKKLVQPQNIGESLLTTEELAQYYKIHVESIRRWIREKRLPALKIGRQWRIAPSELHKIMNSGGL